ncbi:MAG: hypothetical protein JST00_26210 [Deltaproteobacteria bacterium]|nr:hypothetical protein [Deltaproteobacteria bacterium]
MPLTYERPREREVGLGPSASRSVRAFIEALFARKGEGDELVLPPRDRTEWVCNEIDDFVARASMRSYLVVVLSLFVVDIVAPLFLRRVGRLASLEPADRIHALERFEKSSLSPVLLAVKALVCIHYYEHPDAAREVGFDGACLGGER